VLVRQHVARQLAVCHHYLQSHILIVLLVIQQSHTLTRKVVSLLYFPPHNSEPLTLTPHTLHPLAFVTKDQPIAAARTQWWRLRPTMQHTQRA
jgi:hypothetical protein